MELKNFRLPGPCDILEEITFCRHHQGCSFWGRMMPFNDHKAMRNKFSIELVEKRLRYGSVVVSKEVRKKQFEIDGVTLGELDYVVVDTLHGKKFFVFNFECFIGILPI